MVDIVTFGEGLIRFSPGCFQRLEQACAMDLAVGGAELNVAVGASRLGMRTAWVSKLPDNPLGRMIRNKAREHGVDTGQIHWCDAGRVGLYFLELGATPRNTSVLYDRAGSAFSTLAPGELNWESILESAGCLHVTGITPAVSPSAAQATMEALESARRVGCKVSMDLNYRAKLWDPDTAARTLEPMMSFVDILITTAGDTHTVLGISADSDAALAVELGSRFPCEVIALTHREGGSVWKCSWSGLVHTPQQTVTSRVYEVDIVDQVGRGDAFAAGFLAGYLPEGDIAKGLDIGIAFSALKHSIPGDVNWCDRRDVEALLAGPAPGVSR